jgi:hypothetical protein
MRYIVDPKTGEANTRQHGKIEVLATAFHRNGVGGAPFEIVLFKESGELGGKKVAILFEEKDRCAVLDVDKLAAGDIAFGSNSWRGDVYEDTLRGYLNRELLDA